MNAPKQFAQWSTVHYKKLRGVKACNWLVPPTASALISGAKYACQTRDGAITLHYMDGTTETRLSDKDMVREFDSYFAVVSFVQAARNAA